MRDLTIAIAGFGKGAEVYHAPFITTTPGLNLKLVNERHRNRSKELYPHVQIVTDFRELLDADIDIILITTPNDLHFEMAREALKAGKHVVVDKPFTITSGQADELIGLAGRMGRIITVYHNRRLDGPFVMLKKVYRERMIGFFEEVEIRFDRFRPEVNPSSWKETERKGGGLLYDLGPHLVDQALALAGFPELIKGKAEIQRQSGRADDFFDIELTYPYFKIRLVAGMLAQHKTPHISVRGSEGKFVVNELDTQESALKAGLVPGSPEWREAVTSIKGFLLTEEEGLRDVEILPGDYGEFYRNLVTAVNKREKLLIDPSEARNVVSILEKVSASRG